MSFSSCSRSCRFSRSAAASFRLASSAAACRGARSASASLLALACHINSGVNIEGKIQLISDIEGMRSGNPAIQPCWALSGWQ